MMCHQMMGEMRAADSKLEQLVNEMNAATGGAKVAALAQIVNRTRSPAGSDAQSHGRDGSRRDDECSKCHDEQ